MEHFLIDLKKYSKDGKFIGHVEVRTNEENFKDDRIWIEDLYVIDTHRHTGEGTELMKRAIDTCKKLSIPRVYLWCDPKQVPFYKKFGAEEVDQNILGYRLMVINNYE